MQKIAGNFTLAEAILDLAAFTRMENVLVVWTFMHTLEDVNFTFTTLSEQNLADDVN